MLTIIFGIVMFMTVLCVVGYIASRGTETEEITIKSDSGINIKIAQISDLHFPNNATETESIITEVKKFDVDFIVLTGDIADGSASKEDMYSLIPFLTKLSEIAKCFLVIGNHEIGNENLNEFLTVCDSCGICTLLNQVKTITIKNKKISFIGISDAYPYNDKIEGFSEISNSDYKILLAHRPEKFLSYIADEKTKPDLVFSGHAHGGLIRLGFSLYAPNQGLFPKYTSGLYEKNGSYMIVSRGLGVSGVDFRMFNKYHIPVAVIES